MSTHPCAFCGLDQEIPAGRHDHAQLCITALRAALAEARRALDDSTSLLGSLRGTPANEDGAVDEQIAANRAALGCRGDER